jgi:hypothetical protein
MTCPICLEDDPLDRTLYDCGHRFHSECVFKWLDENNSCPVCRHPILPSVEFDDQCCPDIVTADLMAKLISVIMSIKSAYTVKIHADGSIEVVSTPSVSQIDRELLPS